MNLHYDRNRDLPRVLPLWPHELDAIERDPKAHAALILKIIRRCRALKSKAGTPHYQGTDHRTLYAYLQYERAIYRDKWCDSSAASILDDCDLRRELGVPRPSEISLVEERRNEMMYWDA